MRRKKHSVCGRKRMTKWPTDGVARNAERYIRFVLPVVFFFLSFVAGRAVVSVGTVRHERPEDSLRISLLTCSPGTRVYELYGHTALRVRKTGEPEQDWAFNYGMFSFDRPNFVWRFVKGETDYQLGVMPYTYFLLEYEERGSYVVEQELNLTPDEKERLYGLLRENLRPENREYRYNFLYNNCTTRARDAIAACLDGTLRYPEVPQKSFRAIIHEYTQGFPWEAFGQDLLLGSEADRPRNGFEQMFAPFYYSKALDRTVVVGRDGTERPLVKRRGFALPETVGSRCPDKTVPFTPLRMSVLLLAVTCLTGWVEFRRNKTCWWYDLFLFGIQGIVGCVVALLFFVSEHPAVGSNWLIIVFNPLVLGYLPFMIRHSVRNEKDPYHVVASAVLMIFIILIPLIPQKIPSAIVVLALNLWSRSITKLYIAYRKHQIQKV